MLEHVQYGAAEGKPAPHALLTGPSDWQLGLEDSTGFAGYFGAYEMLSHIQFYLIL